MESKKAFCLAPFRSVYLNNGIARPCCWYDRSKMKNRDTRMKDVSDVFYSEEFKEIRKNMLSGENIDGCGKCLKHEAVGGKSHRDYWNKREFSNLSPSDTAHQLKALDVYMGNLCNLKCVSCNSYNSSSWIKDEEVLFDKVFQNYIEKFDLEGMSRKSFENVEWIKLAGGETLLMPEHDLLLDFLINEGLSSEISLVYVCNNTVSPSRFLNKWNKFKNIRIILSVDGIGKVNEYARYPSKWKVNEAIIDEYLGLGSHYQIEVNTVVSLLNILHLADLHKWWSGKGLGLPIFYRLLDRPMNLRIQRLPMNLRQKVIENIASIPELSHVMKELKSDDAEEGFDESIKWLEHLDTRRSISIKEVNPQFY